MAGLVPRVLDRAESSLLRARFHLAEGDRSLAKVRCKAFRRAGDPRHRWPSSRFIDSWESSIRPTALRRRRLHLVESLSWPGLCGPLRAGPDAARLGRAPLGPPPDRPSRSCSTTSKRSANRLEPTNTRTGRCARDEIQHCRKRRAIRRDSPSVKSRCCDWSPRVTNREIGDRLFISHRTVEHHVSNIYNKIGIGSRAAAAVWAKEQGVI